MHMKPRFTTLDTILAGVVLTHLGLSMIHGVTHLEAHVLLSSAAMLFVIAVILVGPVLGLIVQRFASARVGAWLITTTLAAAMIFGLVNHFVLSGPDHVMHVAPPWRMAFASTAALLLLTETFGSSLALWRAIRVDG
jgi:hypothetical protein